MSYSSSAGVPVAPAAASQPGRAGHELLVRVQSIHATCENVNVVTLVAGDSAQALPAFTAGSHVDVHLPNGLVRSYSLCNAPGDAQQYVLGILCDQASRGGSAWLHASLKQGDLLGISAPRNHFALNEEADEAWLIAGGIGVTPILSMIHQLRHLGKSVQLLYCARSRAAAPFMAELTGLVDERVNIRWHFDDEQQVAPDLKAFIDQAPAQGHLYCCGPSAMLQSFESLCEGRDPALVHVERFKQDEQAAAVAVDNGVCTVELARTGVRFTMKKGVPVLEGIQSAGIEPDWSCGEGVCGACETKIIAGQVDHRDAILNAAQRGSNAVMMICVSCCRSDELVLDL